MPDAPKLAVATGGSPLEFRCPRCRRDTPTFAPVVIKQTKGGIPVMQGECAAIVRQDGEPEVHCAAVKTKRLPKAPADH